ncbi:MAG: hypothetical protein ACFFB5_19740 [Promethearchaeota archaeon]
MDLRNNSTRLGLISIFLLGFMLLIFSPKISLANDDPSGISVEFGDVISLNYTLWVENIMTDF